MARILAVARAAPAAGPTCPCYISKMGAPTMRRPSSPDWMRPITDRLSPTIRALVIASALSYAFYVMVPPVRPFFHEHLALGPRVLAGELWQLATSLFVHIHFVSFFFNMLGVWFVGAAIERQVGRRRFLLLFFVPALAANAAMVLVAAAWFGWTMPFSGCSTAILGLFVVFGRLFDRMQARVFGSLVLEARTLSFILVGFSLVADLANLSFATFVGDVVAVVSAYVLSGGRGESIRQFWRKRRSKGSRRRYQVLDGGRTDRPTYIN